MRILPLRIFQTSERNACVLTQQRERGRKTPNWIESNRTANLSNRVSCFTILYTEYTRFSLKLSIDFSTKSLLLYNEFFPSAQWKCQRFRIYTYRSYRFKFTVCRHSLSLYTFTRYKLNWWATNCLQIIEWSKK